MEPLRSVYLVDMRANEDSFVVYGSVNICNLILVLQACYECLGCLRTMYSPKDVDWLTKKVSRMKRFSLFKVRRLPTTSQGNLNACENSILIFK